MIRVATTTILLAVLLLSGCSRSQSAAPSSVATSAYPTNAAAVIADPAYKRAFTSALNGATYYVRRLAKDEVASMPKEYVISDESTAVLVVPIKDGKIVEFGTGRVAEFFSRSPEEMLK